jgi:ribonucleoside-diphosphate reductase alpha chain
LKEYGMTNELLELKQQGKAPQWLTLEGFQTLKSGYLLDGETPVDMYRRVSKSAAKNLNKPELEDKFYSIIYNNWLGLSTPIASNSGTERGLPVSCFGQYVQDSVDGIFKGYHETAMLTKNGGGIGKYYGAIRPRGAAIRGNGKSEGIIPWLKVDEQVIQSTAQGGVRRGAEAIYLEVEHGDIDEFIDIRRPTGDPSRRCQSSNFHHAVIISDDFMEKALNGAEHERNLWNKILKARVETGEPYLMFGDTANKKAPETFGGRKIYASQLCNEIFLPSSDEYTYVCVLSSLNLARYDEWKDTDTVKLAIMFLDAIVTEFNEKSKSIPGLDKARRMSEDARPLGLGVLGWHTLLQEKSIPFDSYESMMLNAEIFSKIRADADQATKELAKEYGACPWDTTGTRRNATLLAIAPTVSNSLISGGVSQGVEPIGANIYAQKSAKGTFIRKNPVLEKLLESKGLNTVEVWNQINKDKGSVKNVDGLSDLEKEVFFTAREINQFAIVRQAGQRQKWIDQGQSINLFFAMPDDVQNEEDKKKLAKYIHSVHLEAWQLGLKGLYYLRPESVLKGDSVFKDESDCKSCEA